MVFLKEFFKKIELKKSADDINMKNFTGGKEDCYEIIFSMGIKFNQLKQKVIKSITNIAYVQLIECIVCNIANCFLTNPFKHVFWVLKRTVSLKRFF